MDKYFIQNAFKSLDEIEAEMEKENYLTESINNKEKNNITLNENLDLDELEAKYNHTFASIKPEAKKFPNEVVEILGLDSYNKDFKNSIWNVCTNGGDKFKIKGDDLILKLEENLPRPLAKAYAFVNNYLNLKKSTGQEQNAANAKKINYFPTAMSRRYATIDFANSNYDDISNEDRNEIIKKYKDQKYKLRLLFRRDGKEYIQKQIQNHRTPTYMLMMWDKNTDDYLISPNTIVSQVSADSPFSKYSQEQVSPYSFKNLVTYADKIYVTDEDEHTLTPNTDVELSADEQELKNNYDELSSYLNTYNDLEAEDLLGSNSFGKVARSNIYKASQYLQKLHSGNRLDIPDTGNHKDEQKQNINYALKNLRYYQSRLKGMRENNASIDDIRYILDSMRRYQYRYNQLKRDDENKRSAEFNINFNVTRYLILKLLSKRLLKLFDKTDRDVISRLSIKPSSDMSVKINNLANNKYRDMLNTKHELEKSINSLLVELKGYQDELAALSRSISAEDIQEYQENKEDVLEELTDKYEDVVSRLTDLTKKVTNETDEDIHESLDLDNIKETYQLRIYTRDFNGVEDFIDDFSSDEEAKDKYYELCDSGLYEQVCLVKIKEHDDLNSTEQEAEIVLNSDDEEDLTEDIKDKRSIGEIVDDKLKNEELEKNSLKESKSFNLSNSEDVSNARVYKKVGEATDEDLVVIDPTIESLDDTMEPHVGDAILQCESCKKVFFKPVDKLVKDETEDIYNKDEPCPHCGAKDGFKYLYQVGDKESLTDEAEKTDDLSSDSSDEDSNLEPVDTDYVDLDDVKEVQEESFNRLINPYLTKLYENVESFKTTNIKQSKRNEIIIEGKIIGKNKKEKLVEFLFKTKENKGNSIVFEGYNKLLTDKENAFKLKGNVNNQKLIFESFEYNYNKNIDGNQVLIEGIEK